MRFNRYNITGNQGNRYFLRARGIEFDAHNPTLEEIKQKAQTLNLKRKSGREALELLENLTGEKLGGK